MRRKFFVLGIDPGKFGAVWVMNSEGKFLGVHDCPLNEEGGASIHPDAKKMAALILDILAELDPECPVCAALEQAIHIPKQNVGTSAQFMYHGGVWEGILAASGIWYQTFHPASWKRKMLGCTGGDKEVSLTVARELFPDAAVFLQRKKDDGRAEAGLLAEYMRRLIRAGVLNPQGCEE